MYLQALKLHGFKSFADSTTLRFEPGVTAVVGPNGCGKSNIADAIRWVLGEQSAKALRGGRMQDVIFEGTDTRKPAQICEVSLLLTECEKQLGSEFHEIEIMRRVHRDGESEYYFNGQPCRLKDIHKLFMDTGIGRTSYSIMAQGQIDQVLSSKPEERRAVFEEAAGITKYKSQRREAMNKLALTEQNMARVADVVGEVGRQIGSMRRQAAKAIRYKRLGHRYRQLSLAWAGLHHARLMESVVELEAKVATLRAAADARRASLQEREGALVERRTARQDLGRRVQEAQQAVYDVRSRIEASGNAATLADTRRAGLGERLAASRDHLGEIEMQLREVSEQVDSGAQDRQMQLGLLGTSDATFQQRNRDVAVADGQVSRLEQDLQQARFELLQLESTVARLRADCSGYEVEQKTAGHRRDLVAGELAKIQAERDAAATAVAGLDERVAQSQEARQQRQAEADATQASIAALTSEFREAQRRLQETDRQIVQRGARLKLLQQLQAQGEGFAKGAKAVLQGRLEGTLTTSRAVPILQGLTIRPEWGSALEALLGAAAEAIFVGDAATARQVLSKLESERIGSAVLRVPEIAARETTSQEIPAGLVPATEALEGHDSDHPAVGLLAGCYLADDLGAFLDFLSGNPDFVFVAVATRKGELVDRRGLVSGGFQDSEQHAHSLVQREIDLRETSRLLSDDQKAHAERRTEVDAVSARLAEAEQQLEQRRAELLAATQSHAAAQTEHRTAGKGLQEIAARVDRMNTELAGLDQTFADARQRWERAQGELATADGTVAAQRERIRGNETSLENTRVERDGKREALAQARLELAERRQKVEVLDRGLGEMEKRRHQLSDLLVQRRQEIEAWEQQIRTLEAESAAQREQAAALGASLGSAQQEVEDARSELSAVEQAIAALEEAQAGIRAEADAAQSDLGSQEVRLAELRQQGKFLAEDMAREFEAEVAGLDWRRELWKADDEPEGLRAMDLDDEPEGEDGSPATVPAADSGSAAETHEKGKRKRKARVPRGEPTEADLNALDSTDWEAVKAEIAALRQRMHGMGAVNLVAIEEYSELKQRHDFLTGQSADLTRARSELLGMIDEINRTSLRQFEVTFEQIRKNFSYTFQELFGGGRAGLELIAAEDVLESGIEIVAQPPGTRLKSISLLSGGQKTLTAVALLFALYMVKPSPFCMLDELDAPLDESNIGRFTALLGKFVKDSQFIIITHNKRTVAAADAIYGVTMEERGASKTVSMRFNHERGEAEQHSQNLAEAVSGARAGAN